MKKKSSSMLAALTVGLVVATTAGCDWTTGSSSSGAFNTSQGAGVTINYSGFYQGEYSGRATANTGAGNITSFTLTQAGNKINVIDNNGSRYSGSSGSPGLIARPNPTTGAYPAGADLVQGQVGWSGRNKATGRDIEFVGIIRAVAVRDIQGSQSQTQSGESVTTTRTFAQGTNTVRETTITIGVPGDPFYQVTVTTEVLNPQNQVISTSTRTSGNSTSNLFEISDANTQYRLEGTWIEKNGPTTAVRARAAGASGVITLPAGGGGGDDGGAAATN